MYFLAILLTLTLNPTFPEGQPSCLTKLTVSIQLSCGKSLPQLDEYSYPDSVRQSTETLGKKARILISSRNYTQSARIGNDELFLDERNSKHGAGEIYLSRCGGPLLPDASAERTAGPTI